MALYAATASNTPFGACHRAGRSGSECGFASVLGVARRDASEGRRINLSRRSPHGVNLTGDVRTPLTFRNEWERDWQGNLEAATIKGVPALDNAAFRMSFNGRLAAHEEQYILCNYKIVEGREV